MKRVKISGIGSYIPEKVLDNAYFEKIVDTSNEWIIERTGIRERRVVADGETNSDISAAAARIAIEDAGISAKDIDLIIVGTVTADTRFPAAACYVGKKLGCGDVGTFDISAGCSGYVYGLSVAVQFIKTGMYKNILVIGTEILSSMTDYTDRNTCVLFGDGSGATVITESNDESEIISTRMFSREEAEILYQPAGGSAMPATHETVEKKLHKLRMKGPEMFKFAVPRFTELIKMELEENNLKPDDIKLVVPHQVNIRIMEAFSKRCGIPMERIHVTLDWTGNISTASIPVALHDARKKGIIERGDYLIFVAVGAGITWASALVRY